MKFFRSAFASLFAARPVGPALAAVPRVRRLAATAALTFTLTFPFTPPVHAQDPAPTSSAAKPTIPALWAERTMSVVAVEYITQSEVERQPSVSMGTVIDSSGTIILQAGSIDSRAPTSQLKDFKVYLPGDAEGFPAEYLGQDSFTGWHFVRAGEQVRAQLVPITTFAAKDGTNRAPVLAEHIWGIGLRGKDEDFLPYIMQSYLAMIQSLPQRTGITQHEVAAPGLPVFDKDGVFLGLATSPGVHTYLQFGGRGARGPQQIALMNVEESSAFIVADEVVPYFSRIPKNISGRPLSWHGAYGFEPMDRDVAKFFNLSGQSGVVVSEVTAGSPADKAGLKNGDIILAIDTKPLPLLKPDRVVTSYIEQEFLRRAPGQTLALGVLRGSDRLEVRVELAEEPKLAREADRKYYDRVGLIAREFVFGDAIQRRESPSQTNGVIAHYVKTSSPVAIAGLRPEDWIKEIDGAEIKTFAEATAALDAIERDTARPEFVMLVSRGPGDTAVLRVKLR